MRSLPRTPAIVFALTLAGACSPPPPADGGSDTGATDAASDAPATDTPDPPDGATGDAAPDVELAHGCPVLRAPQGMPGDAPMGDTYAAFAAPLFQMVCVRCHSSTLTTPDMRNGAPDGLNWDQESVVRMNLPLIRNAVGVLNYMPFNPPPDLSCDQRRHLVRWIDIGAP